MLPAAVVLVLVVAPLAFAALGAWRTRGRMPARAQRQRWDWRFSAASILCYVLAFNLVFFVQEVLLVLPKAALDGVRSTLFHNNHSWEGEHWLTEPFQGTGALATLLLGVACLAWLRRGRGSPTPRLLLFWLAFCGVYMALPQLVLGAIEPRGDVGRAMAGLGLSAATKTAVALLALLAMPWLALRLHGPLLSLADDPARVATPGARHRFVLLSATLPALLGIALVVPFRMPREWIEVLAVPIIVSLAGLAWLQAGAWRAGGDVRPMQGRRDWPLGWLLLAVLALLAFFQLLLRRGLTFG